MAFKDLQNLITEIEEALHGVATELRSYPRSAMGLVMEDAKDARWSRLKDRERILKANLRRANSYAKSRYPEELRRERLARLAARRKFVEEVS